MIFVIIKNDDEMIHHFNSAFMYPVREAKPCVAASALSSIWALKFFLGKTMAGGRTGPGNPENR